MTAKIQLRRDTAANWASSNPVLSQGEIGLATDTGDFKWGDGSTAWSALSPWSPNAVNGASKLVAITDNGYGAPLLANAQSTPATSEMMFTVGVAATNITAIWNHSYVSTPGNADSDPAGSITFNASLRVVSSTNPGTVTGTLYRLTFGGRTTATLDPGGKITADPLGMSLAAGDVVAIRTFLASGTAYSPRGVVGAVVSGWGGVTATTDLTAPGSTTIPSVNGNFYGPSAVLGYAVGAGSAKSVLVVGDSIAAGYDDIPYYTLPNQINGGFAMRALSGVAGVLNIGMPGDSATAFRGTNGSFRRLAFAKMCNSAIIEYGTNDFVFGGATAAQVEAINLNTATNLRRLGISKVCITTIVPRTTSTDGWATTGNQTTITGESQRVAYNTWVRAHCPIDPTTLAPVAVGTTGALLAGSFRHPLTGFFDTAATVESSLNSGLWIAARRVATGSITSGSTTLTSSTAVFQTANQEAGGDLGTGISLLGAGASGGLLAAVLSAVGGSTTATVTTTAGATVTNAQLNIGIATIEGVHPSPRGHALMAAAINTALL